MCDFYFPYFPVHLLSVKKTFEQVHGSRKVTSSNDLHACSLKMKHQGSKWRFNSATARTTTPASLKL